MSFAVARYQTSKVETASPAQLVVALYDGAVRFLKEAIERDARRDIAGRGEALGRAHAIVSELQVTLDYDRNPTLCTQLFGLYDYVLHCIREATIQGDAQKVAPAIGVLESLRSAWSTLARGGP